MNVFLFPKLVEQHVTEVDYGTFLTMLSDKKVSKVELSGDEIYFEDKDNQLYSTNTFEDVNLVDRLQAAGCEFGQVKQQEMDPFLSMILSFVVPLVIFAVIGQLLSRSLMKKMGGGRHGQCDVIWQRATRRSMWRARPESNFSDVAGEDEAKDAPAGDC